MPGRGGSLLLDLLGSSYSGKDAANPAFKAVSKDGGKTWLDTAGKDVTKAYEDNGNTNPIRATTFGERAFAPESANRVQGLRDQYDTNPTFAQQLDDIHSQIGAKDFQRGINTGVITNQNLIAKAKNPDGSYNTEALKALSSAAGGNLESSNLNREDQAMQEGATNVPGKLAQAASNEAGTQVSATGANLIRQPTINQTLNTQANTGLGVAQAYNQALPYTQKDIGQQAQLGAVQSGGALARSSADQTTATLQSELNRLVATGSLSRIDADEAIKDYQARVLQPAQMQAGVFSAQHPQAPYGAVNREVISPSGQVSVQQNPLISNTARTEDAMAGMKLNALAGSGMMPQGQTVKLADGTVIPASTVGGISRPAGNVPPVFPSQQSQNQQMPQQQAPPPVPQGGGQQSQGIIPPAAYQPQATPSWLAPGQGQMSQAQALQMQQQRLMQLMQQGGQGVQPQYAQQPTMIPPAIYSGQTF